MFSLFPEILFLTTFSAFLIRLTLAVILAFEAWRHMKNGGGGTYLAVLQTALAGTLAFGAWTQASALATFALITVLLVRRQRFLPLSTLLVALVLCASLVVTGAGAFAFDLPL